MYCAPSEVRDGLYDCEFVSPWTKSACNLDTELMIVGQDWVSEPFMRDHAEVLLRLGYEPTLPTNRNLHTLLTNHFGLSFSDVYATNVFVYVKPGGMSAGLALKVLTACAKQFLLPQIEIVRPLVAICLGQKAFNSVRRALGLAPLSLKDAAQTTGHPRHFGAEIYGSPHLGARGMNNAGGIDAVRPLWKAFAARLSMLRDQTPSVRL